LEGKTALGGSGFRNLLWAQALGALNDNAFKTLVALWALGKLAPEESSRLIALAGALFVLPFIVFSNVAGALADRYPKKRIIVLLKWIEVGLMSLALPALYVESPPLLAALLLLLGAHSAFFGPVKLAILPEILSERDLSQGNGLVQMATFLGILLGTVCAGLLVKTLGGSLHLAALVLVLIAAAGLWASLRIPDPPAAGGCGPLRFNFAAQTLADLRGIRAHHGIFLSLMGSAYFWFVGAVLQMNLLVYGRQLMGLSEMWLTVFQIVMCVGIGFGSWAAGRLSREQVELGLVPLGALGLAAFSLDLAFSFHSTLRTACDLACLGASAGCFVVPMQAFVQARSPEAERGKFIAAGNVVSFAAILAASGFLWAWSGVFHLHAGQVFLVLSLMTLAVAVYIVWTLPDFLLRVVFYPVANIVYRIQVSGAENIPRRGGALLIANHVSYVDAILVTSAMSRLVRFVMHRSFYESPLLHPFVKIMGCIPISDSDRPRDLVASLKKARQAIQDGEIVCIFAEGAVTRHGQMLRFKKGFERIVQGLDAPIIPVHLDRVWGSVFSFEGGRIFYKWPRRLPYPITVSFGAPMPSDSSTAAVRQSIVELGSDAFRHRLAETLPLPVSFMREVKRHPFRFAMADATGAELRCGTAMVRARLLGGAIVRALPPCAAVGLLLPPSVGAALANVGAAMMGKVTVNLNYTTTRESVLECAARARVGGIVTSRLFLKKIGWEPMAGAVYLEDLARGIPAWDAAWTALGMLLLPSRLAEWIFLARPRAGLDETATIIFTSGSTGSAKGVVLSHANILANIESLGQLFSMRAEDRILGALPFFHSFGHTVTLWFPLIAGFGAVYHPNPLDARKLGESAQKYRPTFLLATPTFLLTYLRRVEPEQFRSLRVVVVGAERLRSELAQAFAERFGVRPLEGYGCTELSPVASANIPDFEERGTRQQGGKPGTVGQALPGVSMRIVDPESGADLLPGSPGLLLVKGPNVMKGYLDDPARTAEVRRGEYYVTGDIAAMDEDGYVTITDRLSRFSKIGGEMVPHVKVEERLHSLAGRMEQAFVVTGRPDEKRGERLIVLYKGYDDIEGLWRRLNESDLPKLWIPARDAFHPIAEFPLLGSGKLDMRKLKALAESLAP